MANQHPEPRTFEGEETRQAEIILRSTQQRLIFAGSLVAVVIIAILAVVFLG